MEGSLVAYKVFTNGSVLQASEINENLMRQAVSVFSNAASRTAAVTSPVEGQMTYLEDTNLYASWNGSSWISPFGTTLLAEQVFTGAGSVTVDNVFTSEFDAYKIIMGVTSSTTVDATFQLRASGSAAASNYNDVSLQAFGSGTAVTSNTGQTTARIVRIDTDGALLELLLNNPNRAARTYGIASGVDSLNVLKFHAFSHTLANVYTGFQFNMSNTTGRLRVYGLRNA
jgi:hypothetical protein